MWGKSAGQIVTVCTFFYHFPPLLVSSFLFLKLDPRLVLFLLFSISLSKFFTLVLSLPYALKIPTNATAFFCKSKYKLYLYISSNVHVIILSFFVAPQIFHFHILCFAVLPFTVHRDSQRKSIKSITCLKWFPLCFYCKLLLTFKTMREKNQELVLISFFWRDAWADHVLFKCSQKPKVEKIREEHGHLISDWARR